MVGEISACSLHAKICVATTRCHYMNFSPHTLNVLLRFAKYPRKIECPEMFPGFFNSIRNDFEKIHVPRLVSFKGKSTLFFVMQN